MYKKYRIKNIVENTKNIGVSPLDIMVTGVTGAGKSTTLNSLFKENIAKIGHGVDPQTMELTSYNLNEYLRLWDTPGFGDNPKQDTIHAKKITNLLHKRYKQKNKIYGFIDIVLVIIEGSNRDMGSTYKLLNETIVPNFPKSRILVAINKADLAMKGRNWDYLNNKPKEKLEIFLNKQVDSIQERVKEGTGVEIIKPIYYSAEYNYNIKILLNLIINNMPLQKRVIK